MYYEYNYRYCIRLLVEYLLGIRLKVSVRRHPSHDFPLRGVASSIFFFSRIQHRFFFRFQEYLEAKIVQLESELVAERRVTQRERTVNSRLQKQLSRVSRRVTRTPKLPFWILQKTIVIPPRRVCVRRMRSVRLPIGK